MASENQLDALRSQVTALNRDFVTLSRQVEAIASQLQHLEKGSYPEAPMGNPATLHSLHKEQDSSISKRLHALEAASARTSTMLKDVCTTSDRLAQLALTSEARALKEMRHPATSSDGLTGYFVDAQETNKRLSILEERLSEVAHDLATQSRSIANLPNLDRILPLEQSISALQSQIQNSDQNRVETTCTTLQQSPTRDKQQAPADHAHTVQTLSEDVQQASIDELQYEFAESIWDLSLFVFTDILSTSASFVVGLCFVLNVALLVFFIDMCFSLSVADFNEVTRDYFGMWRTSVAHNMEFRNRFTGESLAHSVCNKRLYTPIAGYQLETVQLLEDYLGPPPFLNFGVPKGQWMCWLSMCVWYLTLTVELRGILEITGGFKSVKIGRQTEFKPDESDENKHMVHLVKISRFRVAFLVMIIGIRLVTMLFLAYEGTLFLCYEVSTQDMILNSVALQLMLNFDEMMFDSLVPNVPQQAIRCVMPLQRGRQQKGWRKAFNRVGIFFFIWFLYLVCFVAFNEGILQPFVNELRKNKDALCGGNEHNLNFVVAIDSIGIPWAAPTPEADRVKDTYAFSAINQILATKFHAELLQPTQRNNSGPFMQVESGSTLENLMSQSPEFKYPKDWSTVDPYDLPDVVGWADEFLVLGNNQDFGDMPGTVYNRYVQFLLEMSGPANCSHVPFEKCATQGSSAEAVVFRQLCANRCGCNQPLTGTVANPFSANTKYMFFGCAAFNLKKGTFVDQLDSLPCTDTTSRDVFVSWAEGFGKSQNATGADLFTSIVRAFERGGCEEVVQIWIGKKEPSRVCAATSLPTICPWSCGCNTDAKWTTLHTLRMEFCPSSCQRQPPICLTIKKDHVVPTGDRGPFVGFACVFPFVYKGKEYNTCTSDDWEGPWCSIGMMHGSSYRWGDCPNTNACLTDYLAQVE